MTELRGEESSNSAYAREAIDDVHVAEIEALAPHLVMDEFPCTQQVAELVGRTRRQVAACMAGVDDRIVAIVGPCSVHDPKGAMEYARRLKCEADRLSEDVLVIMRVYFEKPRTTVGWKGLINDPYLDESFQVNDGFRIGRKLLKDVNSIGLPVACEFLDTLTPQYISDLVSWAAIGARTTESQMHRELASGMPMPVGFKNGTSGDVEIAIDAVQAARHPHCFLSMSKHGTAAIVRSKGNAATHVVLRGGKSGPNFGRQHTEALIRTQSKAGVTCGVMVDCSHGNSCKDHKNQPKVLKDVCNQIRSGVRVCGVMVESNLFEGRQDLPSAKAVDKAIKGDACIAPIVEEALTGQYGSESQIFSSGLLRYGVSITDACVDWTTTVEMLQLISKTVRDRREALHFGPIDRCCPSDDRQILSML